jgi:hypothetical protein
MAFPHSPLDPNVASAIKIAPAKDINGNVVGVEVTMLVKTERVKELPSKIKQMAQGVLYQEATKKV